MILLLYLIIAAFLLALNAFFVLAEFSAVKMRPSRVEELVAQGNLKARIFQRVQSKIDEYLSVCQVGITCASIGLGFVGEPAFARIIVSLTGMHTATAHSIAITLAYIVVSGLHIVVGELLPKSLAIRSTERSALSTAIPLRFFRYLFFVPLVVLNGATLFLLKAFGVPPRVREAEHSEEELKILLARSQDVGLMSFDRLLLVENIFDLGGVCVRDIMRPRENVVTLRPGNPWAEQYRIIRETRLSRYPLVEEDGARPLGVIHVKDLFYEGPERVTVSDLRKMARPYLTTSEDAPIEKFLGELRRQRGQLAVVCDAKGKWTGVVTMEDVLEEIVGTIEDEFEVEPAIYLANALAPGRVVLGVRGESLEGAIRALFAMVPQSALPVPVEVAMKAVLERERSMSTYLGKGLAVPHARLDGLARPVLLVGRAEEGIPVAGRNEKAYFLFVILTPAGSPRTQIRLLARVCGIFESEYVADHLREARNPEEMAYVIRAAEPISL